MAIDPFYTTALSSLYWPALVGLTILGFRKRIAAAIDRLKSLNKGGAEFEPAGDQKASPVLEAPRGVVVPPIGVPVIDRLQELGRDALERDARAIMTARPMPIEAAIRDAGANYLVRWTFDTTYYRSFGSQLELLQAMHVHNGSGTLALAQSIWDRAKTNWPQVHAERTFEQWMDFLIGSGLIRNDGDDRWRFTEVGALFVPYLGIQQAPLARVG